MLVLVGTKRRKCWPGLAWSVASIVLASFMKWRYTNQVFRFNCRCAICGSRWTDSLSSGKHSWWDLGGELIDWFSSATALSSHIHLSTAFTCAQVLTLIRRITTKVNRKGVHLTERVFIGLTLSKIIKGFLSLVFIFVFSYLRIFLAYYINFWESFL